MLFSLFFVTFPNRLLYDVCIQYLVVFQWLRPWATLLLNLIVLNLTVLVYWTNTETQHTYFKKWYNFDKNLSIYSCKDFHQQSCKNLSWFSYENIGNKLIEWGRTHRLLQKSLQESNWILATFDEILSLSWTSICICFPHKLNFHNVYHFSHTKLRKISVTHTVFIPKSTQGT